MDMLNRQIMTFIHFNVMIRDTIEYGMSKEKFDLRLFNVKKNGISGELSQETPLKVFIEKNGENGQKVKEKIDDLYNSIYGDDSTICRIAGEELRVDNAQSISVFEKVIPLHEELRQIIEIHLNAARQNQKVDKDVEELVALDERFYRGIVWLAIIPEIEKQFIEFNKVRREANGAVTPQSNFIQNDLSKLSSLLAFSRQHARVRDREYTDVLDQVFDLLEEIQGRRELRTGHKFETDFADVKRSVQQFVAKNEPVWKAKYDKLMNQFIEEIKQEQNSNQAKASEERKDA